MWPVMLNVRGSSPNQLIKSLSVHFTEYSISLLSSSSLSSSVDLHTYHWLMKMIKLGKHGLPPTVKQASISIFPEILGSLCITQVY